MRRAMWVTIAAAVATGAHAQGMRLVGRSDLGGAGLNGDVTVVGTKAVRIVQMAYPQVYLACHTRHQLVALGFVARVSQRLPGGSINWGRL